MDETTPRARTRWLRALQAGALLTAIGLGVVPFAADAVREGRAPTDAGVNAATRAIRASFRAGDAVVVVPSWYTLPWRALERMGPGTDAWPYPALLLSEDLDVLDVLTHRRLWVLTGFDRAADAPELVAGALSGRVEVPLQVDDGHVAVARYDVAGVEPLKRLSRDAAELVVRRGPPGGKMTACKWRGDRHRCNRDGVLDLHREDRVVARHTVDWFMAVPGDGGEALEIDWPKLPAGGNWLFVRAGWTQQAVREPAGSSTTLTIFVDGKVADTVELPPQRYELERRAVRLDSDKPVTVTLRVQADELDARELMLEADVLPTLPDVLRAWATSVVE